jgi:hypothetical protein
MPKNVFWPVALAIMGFVLLSSNLGMLPHNFWNLWPIILIVVGLGGLITADRDEWLCDSSSKSKSKKKNTKTKKRKSSKKSKKK